MNSLWLLLLPISATFGYFSATNKILSHRFFPSSKRVANEQYLKGLTYLINDESDKAVDLFVKMLQVDSDTIETHLTLGHLYRRRGEVDRAIRIHQHLISKPHLNREQRANAIYALAKDYLSAGLLDRAERLFQELIEIGGHTSAAYDALLYIYQQEKDWTNAIAVAQKIEKHNKSSKMHIAIAQLHCELAYSIIRKSNDIESAKKHLEKALHSNPKCARASIKLGDLAMQECDFRLALSFYKKVEAQQPEFLYLVIPKLQDAYSALSKADEFIEYIQELSHRFLAFPLASPLSELLRQYYGDHTAFHIVKQHVQHYPSLVGLNELLTLQVSTSTQKTELEDMLQITKQLVKEYEDLQCTNCGFSSKIHYWQCPSCKNWESMLLKTLAVKHEQ